MRHFTHRFTLAGFGALFLAVVASVCAQQPQQESENFAVKEAQQALRAAIAKNVHLERENAQLEKATGTFAESLAAANRDADHYREAYNDLQLQMEALGIETIKKGVKGFNENYMKAVNDNRILKGERTELVDRIVRLSETVIAYMRTATSSNVETRMAVEAALREADKAIAIGDPKRAERPAKKIYQGGKVVDVKRELGVFAVDLGRKSGVGIGMPIEITRKDRTIGKGYVVDVRDNICGAVLSQLVVDNDSIKIGDTIHLDTQLEF